MTDKQFENFKKYMRCESGLELDKLLDEEIKEQPEKADFFLGLKKNKFFIEFFMRGFLEGIDWANKNQDTKFII